MDESLVIAWSHLSRDGDKQETDRWVTLLATSILTKVRKYA